VAEIYLTSLAVQFHLGFCSKSSTLTAWLASCCSSDHAAVRHGSD